MSKPRQFGWVDKVFIIPAKYQDFLTWFKYIQPKGKNTRCQKLCITSRSYLKVMTALPASIFYVARQPNGIWDLLADIFN